MPLVVFVLSAAVFAQGTSEFMLSGLLEKIAIDTGVSLGAAGLLTSLFAVGMVIGAPTMAIAVGAIPQRTALIGFLGLFCTAHIIGALTTNFALLLCTRVAAAMANAGFLAVTLAILPKIVPAEATGRATSVVLSGVTLACIVGVPAGTVLGQALGWHSAFWAVAVITAAALAVLWATGTTPNTTNAKSATVWRAQGNLIALGVLVNAATFASFTYLGTMTARLTSPDSAWIPIALALFGIGSFVGVTIAGRHSNPNRTLMITALAGLWLAATFTTHTLPGLLATAFVIGAGAFGVGSTLIAALVRTPSPVAGAIATTAFNVGAVFGPVVAGLVVNESAHAAVWVSFGFTAAAALIGRR